MNDTPLAIDWAALQRAAREVLDNAYAEHSNFRVAAAVLGSDGAVYRGVNVENDSYGLTICAERNAIAAAVTAGCRSFAAICVVCSQPPPPSPCGACRQVIHQFEPRIEVRCYGSDGRELIIPPGELLPHPFEL